MCRRVLRPSLAGGKAAGAFGDKEDLFLRLRRLRERRAGFELEAGEADIALGEAAQFFPSRAALTLDLGPGQVGGAEVHRLRRARLRILERAAVLVLPDRLIGV